MNIHELEERLGHTFKDITLLETALTHPSYGSDHRVPHYQRLEFLGDAVLELAVSRYLYFKLPKTDEGKLTRIRADLVREETLSRVAAQIDLGSFLRLSVGEDRSGGRFKPSILCDVTESVLAAVYLDAGFEEAEKLISRLLLADLTPGKLQDSMDCKTRLQERLQRKGLMPTYEQTDMQGPPHAPVFYYRVLCGGEELGRGAGTSKQLAQQQAAREALIRMERNGD